MTKIKKHNIKLKRYRKNFKKTVWGFVEVHAKNKEEAEQQYIDSNYDEFDNKSDYEFEEWKEEQT